jgi:hypothetical protein
VAVVLVRIGYDTPCQVMIVSQTGLVSGGLARQ